MGSEVISCWKVAFMLGVSIVVFAMVGNSHIETISTRDKLVRVAKDHEEARDRLETPDYPRVHAELEVSHGDEAADGQAFPVGPEGGCQWRWRGRVGHDCERSTNIDKMSTETTLSFSNP